MAEFKEWEVVGPSLDEYYGEYFEIGIVHDPGEFQYVDCVALVPDDNPALAHLFSASREMLEVLEFCLDGENPPHTSGWIANPAMRAKIRAVVAKAKGETR